MHRVKKLTATRTKASNRHTFKQFEQRSIYISLVQSFLSLYLCISLQNVECLVWEFECESIDFLRSVIETVETLFCYPSPDRLLKWNKIIQWGKVMVAWRNSWDVTENFVCIKITGVYTPWHYVLFNISKCWCSLELFAIMSIFQ